LAFDDHSFAGFQAVLDNPHCPRAFANLNRSNRDPAVAPDHVNHMASLLFINRGLRNQETIPLDSHDGAHFAVLPRSEHIPWVRKTRGELDRARILIHLAISKIKFTPA